MTKPAPMMINSPILTRLTCKGWMTVALTSCFMLSGCQTPPRQDQANLGDWYRAQSEALASDESSQTIAASDDADKKPAVNTIEDELEIYQGARDSIESEDANPDLVASLDSKILSLKIQQADQAYAENPDEPAIYKPIVADLQAWIQRNPGNPNIEQYRYQLARVLELAGDTETAEAELLALQETRANLPSKRQQEIDFRLAEAAYSQRDYQKAIKHYSMVLEALADPAADVSIMSKALYMRAWSYLQVNQFPEAAQDYLVLLTDERLTPDNDQVLTDTYRGLILTINDAGGLENLPELVDLAALQPISVNVYKRMIGFYTENKRWSEIITAYSEFQKQYPGTEEALAMALDQLEFLEDNDQKASLRDAKKEFIDQFAEQAPERAAGYTLELAEYHRAEALQLQKKNPDAAQSTDADQVKIQQEIDTQFAESLQLYQRYLDTFGQKLPEQSQQVAFAYAETLLEAGRMSEARTALRQLESNPAIAPELQEKAAYLALTTLDSQIEASDDPAALSQTKLEDAAAFVKQYPEHPEVPGILDWLMVESFKAKQYSAAVDYAQQLLEKTSGAPTPKRTLRAYQVIADSEFASNNWLEAAAAYDTLLQDAVSMDAPADQRKVWQNNQLKAYYQAARDSEPKQALVLLAKVTQSTDVELASAALYEAAVLAAGPAEDKELAVKLFNRFLERYPERPNAQDARIRLAAIYKADENWLAAAPLLEQVAQSIDQPELQKTAQLEIADMYFKGKKTAQALTAYETFLQEHGDSATYEETAQVRSRMIDIYLEQDQTQVAYQQMQEFVDENLNASETTKELREQAQDYAFQLVDRQAQNYHRLSITGDLQSSFRRKEAALKQAISAYQQLERFNSEKASQVAHAGIGDLFAGLSQALLKAPVPAGLSEIEQEEYMIIIEEQAFPFEEKAVESHQKNIEMLHQGEWSDAIVKSLESLSKLLPARFDKQERFEGAITHAQ